MNKEIWKAIPGYEGYYEVSDLGRVRSVDREVLCRGGKTRISLGKILKQSTDKQGRLIVGLSKDGKVKVKYPHILVAESFIGQRPKDYEVCHLDGDYTNNKLSNIRYDTKSQNRLDYYRQGKKNPRGKLSIEQVLEIRRLYATGNYTQQELAEKFNVNRNNIGYIITRKYFKWLNDDGTIKESQTAVS